MPPRITPEQIQEYTRLSESVNAANSDHPVPWPSRADYSAREAADLEQEIVALANRIIRRDRLTFPANHEESASQRYPNLPLSPLTRHAQIWRTTESTATTATNVQDNQHYTASSFDRDLQPVLPPNLTRHVTEWLAKLLLNLAAARPAVRQATHTTNTPTSTLNGASVIEALAQMENTADDARSVHGTQKHNPYLTLCTTK